MYASRSNVEAAIQALQARGEKVTTRSVRQELGGGSLEDIAALISQVLLGESAADDTPTLPSLPYALPEPDPDVIQRHLRELQGEAQALALMSHLQELVNSARAVQAIGEPGMNWLFRAVTQMGERSSLNMSIASLGQDLRQVSETAAEMLRRTRREYQRVRGDHAEEGHHGASTASFDHQLEASDAGNS